jgi:FlaG/FlaF family flagellin (archaellin)
MIATVLLIGFTIAVGAILSVWFTTFTRTQTAAVSGAAGCVANPVDVSALDLSNGILTYLLINRGTHPVNFTSATFSCDKGSWTNSSLSYVVSAGSQLIVKENTIAQVGGCTDKTKVSITVYGYCTDVGGVTQGACPVGTCFG